MLTCPGEAELLRHARRQGDESELAGIATHLEACAACRLRVAGLAGPPLVEAGTSTPGAGAGAVIDPWKTGMCGLDAAGPTPDDAPGAGEPAPVAARPGADPLDTVSEGASPPVASPPGAARDRGRGGRPSVPGYEVLEQIGQGGMGVVYKARQVGLNRLVALKMIREDRQMRTDYLARFLNEAEAVARLRHPNIIQIYDIGEVDGSPFVALELLDGGNLGERMAGDPRPGPEAARLMVTLARAVHVAHEAGIIHRDLKPSNILLTAAGVPRISDFGLAKRIGGDPAQTASGQVMGTPCYMAPEQARDSKQVGPAADIYALGAILYEMLSGRPPFKGETPLETVRLVIHEDPVPARRLVPRVARDLDTICLKCLEKEPSRRYRTAEAMADDLQRFLDGEPIVARPTPAWERAAKWARRRPAAAGLLALVATALLAGAAIAARRALDREIESLRVDGTGRIVAAQQAMAEGRLEDAGMMLTRVKERIAGQSAGSLADLDALASTQLETVRRRLADRAAAEARQRDEEKARADLEEFRRLRDEAIFHDTPFTGLDESSNRAAKREAAREALGLYAALPVGDPRPLSLPPSLAERDRAEVIEGCYELLLILAATEPAPEEGLRLLDRAGPLGPPTRAYYLRRAACKERAGDRAAANRDRLEAERIRPAGALDHFLLGQDSYRGAPGEALGHFNDALGDRPDHFWAQCLAAVCLLDVRLARPDEACARLTACLQRRPDAAWLYLLRGLASSQSAGLRLGPAVAGAPLRDARRRREADRHLDRAGRDYERALELLRPGRDDEIRYALLVDRGVLAQQRRRPAEAVEDLEAAIRLRPREAHAHTWLARVYQEHGGPDRAREEWSQAIDLAPDRADLYRSRAGVELDRPTVAPEPCAAALRDLDRAIALERPADRRARADDHLLKARLLDKAHRPADALAACEAALGEDRGVEEAHRRRIKLLADDGRHAEVVRACDEVIARWPSASWAIEPRALARSSTRDYAGAIEDYTRVLPLRREAERAPLLRQRGRLYLLVKAPRQALRDFEEAIRLDPTDGDGYEGRGAARAGLGEFPEAVADAEEALRRGEPSAMRCYRTARIYAQAAVDAGSRARRRGRDAVVRSELYRDRAAALLLETLRRSPAERAAAIWQELQSDPMLRTIHRRVSAAFGGAGPSLSSASTGVPPAD